MSSKVLKVPYRDLRTLLAHEMVDSETPKTEALIHGLRPVRRRGYLTRSEFLRICRWKSPRGIRHCESNSAAQVRYWTAKAFKTRSERVRFEALQQLAGVGAPTASAILALTNPKRYGVIDIRVWQLLFSLKSVRTKPHGVGFTFSNWYHYLKKLQYYAKEFGVPVRQVELTLFRYHSKIQKGVLYRPVKKKRR